MCKWKTYALLFIILLYDLILATNSFYDFLETQEVLVAILFF